MPPRVLRHSRNPILNPFRAKSTTPLLRPNWCADAHKQLFVPIRNPSVRHGKGRRSQPSVRWRIKMSAGRPSRQVQDGPEGEGRMGGWWWTLSAKIRWQLGMDLLRVRWDHMHQRQGGCPRCTNRAHNRKPDDTIGMASMPLRRRRLTRHPYLPPLSASPARDAAPGHLGLRNLRALGDRWVDGILVLAREAEGASSRECG